jgi:hypothetical protein
MRVSNRDHSDVHRGKVEYHDGKRQSSLDCTSPTPRLP